MSLSRRLTAPLVISTALVVASAVGGAPAAAAQKPKPKLDLYGDPLPPGALMRLGTVRYRISSLGRGVPHLAFMPDNKTLVSARNKAIQFWDASTGSLQREILMEDVAVGDFALSSDGTLVAVSGVITARPAGKRSEGVVILDVATGKPKQTVELPSTYGGHVAFTLDARHLVTFEGIDPKERALRINEVATGKEIRRHEFPRDTTGALALSPDGSTLAVVTGANTRKLFLWRWKTEPAPRELDSDKRRVASLAFSPDGKLLVECPDMGQHLHLWDVNSGTLSRSIKASDGGSITYYRAAFSPDGKKFLATTQILNPKGTIHVWDTATWKRQKSLSDSVETDFVSVSPDSRLVAVRTKKGFRVWDLTTEKELTKEFETHSGAINSIAATSRLLVTASDDATVRVWDANASKQLLKLDHGRLVRDMNVSLDGDRIASSSLDNLVYLWETASGKKLQAMTGHGSIGGMRTVRFTPDGKRLLSFGDDRMLRKWDTATGIAILEHNLAPGGAKLAEKKSLGALAPRECAFSPDGKLLFMASLQGDVHFYDVASGKEVPGIPKAEMIGPHIAVSPDSRTLLTCEIGIDVPVTRTDGKIVMPGDSAIMLWELPSRKLRHKITVPAGVIGPCAFSNDGKLLAVATRRLDACVRIWETATCKELSPIKSSGSYVTALAFTADSTRLITGMDDTTALVWEVKGKR